MKRSTRYRQCCRPARLALWLALFAIAACSDANRPTQGPTQPPELAKGGPPPPPTSPVCSDELAKKISDDVGLFLPPKPAAEARALFRTVVESCPDSKYQAAKDAVEYYRYFLTKLYAGVVFQFAGRPAKLAEHFNDIVRFVAQEPQQFLPSMFATGTEAGTQSDPSYGADGGQLKVCDRSNADTPLCTIVSKNLIAGIGVPPSALRDVYPAYVFAIGLVSNARCGRLLSGFSGNSTDLFAENLRFKTPCYDAVVFPHYDNPDQPTSLIPTTFQYPWVTAAVCPVEENETVSSRFRLAIPDPESTPAVADVIKLGPKPLQNEVKDPAHPTLPAALLTALQTFLGHQTGGLSSNCDASTAVASVLRPSNTVVAWLDRLASRAAVLIGPKSLYAGHATTSGTYSSLPKSPIGPVDPRTFFGTFTAFAPGTRLDLLTPPQPSDAGQWTTLFATPPGTITVLSSIGDATLGFLAGSKPVVLSQGGGACGTVGNASCGMLTLEGTVTGPPAVTGIYRVTWKSLQNQPAPKFAPIDVRDSVGNVLARVSYSTEASSRVLRYNATGPGTGQLVGTWKVGVVQEFVLTIDLNSLNTPDAISLTITAPTGTTSACPVTSPCVSLDYFNFPNVATNLYHITADFDGIDSGTLAWDDIEILRLPDQPADY